MSVDYGNGIETGKDVFSKQQRESLNNANEKRTYMSKVEEELTALNKGFDELIEKTREFQFAFQNISIKPKIDNKLTTSLMLEIQNTRDKCINELKAVCLDSE